ncbi:MAG: TRAFs-binding domain-containing protein [Candidatus Omnitrophota bacterium]
MANPLCLVIMPTSQERKISRKTINADRVYEELICPALQQTQLEPLRVDTENMGEMYHKSMCEQIALCEYAIFDLTHAGGYKLYQLGIRHAARPFKTAVVISQSSRFPLHDPGNWEPIYYKIDKSGKLVNKETCIRSLVEKIHRMKSDNCIDSPLFQLFDEFKHTALAHEKTDIFRDIVAYSPDVKERLKQARNHGLEAVKRVEAELGEIQKVESGILIDLLLSYRATEGWQEMIDLVGRMPVFLRDRLMVREQLAFALNRKGKAKEAEVILLDIVDKYGASSETYGLLGRVYKDQWEKAKEQNKEPESERLLEKAIDAYMRGFKSDSRDSFPGINALTLLELKDPDDPLKIELFPVVMYAIKQKIAKGNPDYWDYATLLELAVLNGDQAAAKAWTQQAISKVREIWETKTTARNIKIIREAREKRRQDTDWIKQIETQLNGNPESRT